MSKTAHSHCILRKQIDKTTSLRKKYFLNITSKCNIHKHPRHSRIEKCDINKKKNLQQTARTQLNREHTVCLGDYKK